MKMNMNTTKTNNTKRAGFLFCAALFAFTLLIIPAQVHAGGGGDSSGFDFGSGSTGDSSGFDFGGTTYGSGGYSDTGSSVSRYTTPVYRYYTQPTYSSGGGSTYQPLTYIPYSQNSQGSTPNYNSNSQGQSQNSSNNNSNTNNNKSNSNSKSTSKSTSTATANNTNNIVNTNNNQDITTNVNNNNISLVVYAAGATSTYSNTSDNNQQLDGYCIINPNTAEVNQDLNFMAYPTGGNGNYTYSWSGSDGLSSSAQNFTGRFGIPGYKTAHVTIRSGNQIVTKTCSANVVQRFNPPYNNQLSAYCVGNPSNVGVNQTVTWTVYPTGGNGSYGYAWSGTDSLYGYSQYVDKSYSYTGTKQATVTVTSGGYSTSAVCNVNVGNGSVSNVTVYRQPTSGTPVSGVFLNQVPDTGIDWSMKTTLFAVGLLMWSAFAAYIVIARRKSSLALATSAGSSKEAAFKLANMQKKGLIA